MEPWWGRPAGSGPTSGSNGLTASEISEVVLHTAVYAGIPAAAAALRVAERTLIEIGSLPEPPIGDRPTSPYPW